MSLFDILLLLDPVCFEVRRSLTPVWFSRSDTIECYYDDSPLLTDISLDEIDQVLLKDHDEEEFIERIKDAMDVSFELEPLVLPVKVEPVGIEVEFTPSPAPIVAPVATAIVDIKPTKVIAKRTSIAPPKTTTTAVIASASKRASLKLPIITPSTVVKPPTTRGNRMSLAPAPTTNKSSTAKSTVSAAISAVKANVPTKPRTPLQSITAPNTKSIRAPVFKTKTKTPTLPTIVEAPKVKTTMKNRVSLAPGTRAERFASVNTHTGPVF